MRGRLHTAPIWNFSIGVILHWRRPNFTLETSGHAWANRGCLTGRAANRPRLAEARAPQDDLFMLLYMLAAARLGRGWYDHRNHHHRRVYRQCQNPDREFAHGSLLRFLATRQPRDEPR